MQDSYLKKCLTEVEHKVQGVVKNAPAQQKLSKKGFSFSNLSPSVQLIIWDYIWNNSSDDWTRMHSFIYFESQIKDKRFLVDSWEIIKNWQKRVGNWGDCDALSKIYTKILELIPHNVIKQLKQWNKSMNLWDGRQSIVSLLYFSRTKKVILPFDTIIPFIHRLLNDKEYYVQKAVGWSLKELSNVFPKETLRYLEANIKDISSIAFSPASEKLKIEDKERLKNIRKSSRKQAN